MNLKLDAVDVLYMHYITDRTTEEVDTYDFWVRQYDRNPVQLLRHLLDEGVIYEDDSLHVTLWKLRVFELKIILKSAGLKVSGNKPSLVERIILNEEDIDFTSVPLKNVYKVNAGHEDFYHQTHFIDFFHFNGNIDLHEVYDFYLSHDHLANHDIAIKFLEKKARDHIHQENKYTAVKCYYLLANYAQDEMGDPLLSIYYLNHFTMLVVLQSAHHRGAIHFDLDGYTKDRYRAFIESENMGLDAFAGSMAESVKQLPYSSHELKSAAAFIIKLINEKA